MTKCCSIIVFIVTILSPDSRAQKIENLRVHFGLYAFESDVKTKNMIRSFEPQTSPYAYANHQFDAQYQSLFAGFAAERNLAAKPSVSAGLQYARMTGHLEMNRMYEGPDYFYYRFREEGTVTEYYRIREFQQNAHYVGVPVDLRYSPLNRNFKITVRAGTEINYRIASNGSADFVDREMEQYEDQFIDSFDRPDPLNVIIVVGAGISYGKPGKANYGVEIAGPCVSVTQKAGGMFTPTAGAGFSLFVKVPLNVK